LLIFVNNKTVLKLRSKGTATTTTDYQTIKHIIQLLEKIEHLSFIIKK